jgi:hypothetical protein
MSTEINRMNITASGNSIVLGDDAAGEFVYAHQAGALQDSIVEMARAAANSYKQHYGLWEKARDAGDADGKLYHEGCLRVALHLFESTYHLHGFAIPDEALGDAHAVTEPEPKTPGFRWRLNGPPDPHGSRYDCERAKLTMGTLSDDELANGAFMNYDSLLNVQGIMAGTHHSPIAWMTAVKDRIRWLSRALQQAQAAEPPCTGSWVNADEVDALVRRLDVAINGEAGAAKQASLCDIVVQMEARSRAEPDYYKAGSGCYTCIASAKIFEGDSTDITPLFEHPPVMAALESDESKLYYEAHITIEPVFDERRDRAAMIASIFDFRLADLLMKKREADTEERSSKDTFMTGHSKSRKDIEERTKLAVTALLGEGFKVWRYKIEDTLLDSRTHDFWGLLKTEPVWIDIPSFLRRGDD